MLTTFFQSANLLNCVFMNFGALCLGS